MEDSRVARKYKPGICARFEKLEMHHLPSAEPEL